jgi:hypothetical protein
VYLINNPDTLKEYSSMIIEILKRAKDFKLQKPF